MGALILLTCVGVGLGVIYLAALAAVTAAAGQKGGVTKARRWNKEPWSANGGRPLCTAGGSTGAHSDI